MSHKLTMKHQHSLHCTDGKRRNYWLFFLDGEQILKQKRPFLEYAEKGYDGFVGLKNVHLHQGRIHQDRESYWKSEKNYRIRSVSFPVSKKKLEELGVDPKEKIKLEK